MNELWAQTWQVVLLGMFSTFLFLGMLILSLRIMRSNVRRGNTGNNK
jgi:hypothetical protein